MKNGLFELDQRSYGGAILISKFSELTFVHWIQDSQEHVRPIWSYKIFWSRTGCGLGYIRVDYSSQPNEELLQLCKKKNLLKILFSKIYLSFFIYKLKNISKGVRLKLWMVKIINPQICFLFCANKLKKYIRKQYG